MDKIGWYYMIVLMLLFMLLSGASLVLDSSGPLYVILIFCALKLFVLIFFGPNHFKDNDR